ncbi:transcription antitermination factor NusB [Rhodoflexus sp.]
MLNRRLLRAKAVQSLYAYQQCQQSDYELALDKIASDFLPDLNSMEVQDPVKLAAERDQAQELFKEQYLNKVLRLDKPVSPKIEQSVSEAIKFYHQALKKDYDNLSRSLVRETEKIFDNYLKFLLLLVEMRAQAKKEQQDHLNRKFTQVTVAEYTFKLSKNPILAKLAEHRALKDEALRRNIAWDSEQVREWYKLMLKEEFYQQYRNLPEVSDKDELEIVLSLVKQFLLSNDAVVTYFEESDIGWADNMPVIKSMAIKTIKRIAETPAGEQIPLQELSPNWADDREYLIELFAKGVEEAELAQKTIAERTQNWDIDRITALDKAILNLAISEMIHFPSIPIKVTINEFIEISKLYSTPKSYFFVNGLLNTIATDLQRMGKIRKSGRGLIDNK